MTNNVAIKIYEYGKLVDIRSEHNLWLAKGHAWLADLITYLSFSPDTADENRRVRYFGVGVGSIRQGVQPTVTSPPISTAYPLPTAPNSTTGFNFDTRYPSSPEILTIEAPVRISGSSNPIPQPADVWLVDTPNLFFTHLTPHELTIHAVLDGTAGDVVYSPFTMMPLSEAALFLDDADKNDSLNEAVAYCQFSTVMLSTYSRLEFVWSVRF